MVQVYKEIVRRPVAEARKPFYLPAEEWAAVRDEVAATDLCKARGVLCGDSEFLNFLIAGVEVRVAEALHAG